MTTTKGGGFSIYNKAEYDNTITDYKKAIEINPNYEFAFYNMCAAWVALNDYKEAIKGYSKAIEININYVDAYLAGGLLEDYWKNMTQLLKIIMKL